ncbi:MAG: hypothetical protein KDB73_19905 [Planctomycetes bacterium]|nr:hypothetical protein [Planctomycetota bacterium]
MKGRVKLVVVVAGLHAAAVLATLVLGIGGASAHAGADEAGSARVGWLRASQVLAFPGAQLQAFINGLLPSGERLSSPGEWLIFTGNSLLWGFVLVFAMRRLVRRSGTRRRSSPIATPDG